MSVESKVPAIRFKGFSGEWEKLKLRELCVHFQSGGFIKAEDINTQGKYPVYGGNGLRGYSSTYNYNGMYALIGRQGALCGNMNISYGKAYFTEHAIAVKANNSSDTTFLFYILGKMNLGQYSAQSAQPGLAVNKIQELTAFCSIRIEQTKIGNYFQQLDTLITQHQQKHDKLLNLKKSLLEKMFPKQGATVPEIRFKGFSGAWGGIELDNIGNATSGTSIESEFSGDGKYKVVSIGSYSEKSVYTDQGIRAALSKKTKDRVLNQDDLTMILNDKTSSGNIIGRVLLIKENDAFVYNQRTQRIEPYREKYDSQFLYQLLNAPLIREKIIKQSQGNTQIYVNWSAIKKLNYLIPELVEQTKIGNLFKQLDTLLNQHQAQLKKLNNIKQACLEKMFV